MLALALSTVAALAPTLPPGAKPVSRQVAKLPGTVVLGIDPAKAKKLRKSPLPPGVSPATFAPTIPATDPTTIASVEYDLADTKRATMGFWTLGPARYGPGFKVLMAPKGRINLNVPQAWLADDDVEVSCRGDFHDLSLKIAVVTHNETLGWLSHGEATVTAGTSFRAIIETSRVAASGPHYWFHISAASRSNTQGFEVEACTATRRSPAP
ncbi:MAG: hypothetical protein AAF721_13045 [Myxococcota bacterium]